MKSYNGKIKTEFHDIEIFFSIILTDSVFAIDKNYYPKVFLEEYKDLVQERKLAKIMSS